MKSHGAPPAPERAGRHGVARLTRRLHIGRAVRLLESTLVDVPTVIGWLKPVVLLPASALAGLSPHQLEAILAHELAHIRRHDYLVNLLQTLVETLLFYHPAVWWLSRRIRAERENCCDDLAVSLCGDPVAYAAALAELEGLRRQPADSWCSRRPAARCCSGSGGCSAPRRMPGARPAGSRPAWRCSSVISMSAGAVARDALTGELAGGRTGGPSGARGTGAAGKHASGRCRRSHRAARAIRAAGGDRCRAAVTARAFRRGAAFRTGVGRHDADGSSTGRHSADGSGTARHNADGSDPGGPIRRPDLAITGHARCNRADAGSARGSGNPSSARSRRGGAGCGRSSCCADRLVCELAVHVAHDERW